MSDRLSRRLQISRNSWHTAGCSKRTIFRCMFSISTISTGVVGSAVAPGLMTSKSLVLTIADDDDATSEDEAEVPVDGGDCRSWTKRRKA